MKKYYVLLAVALVIAGALATLISFPPTGYVEKRIKAAIARSTGHELTVAGGSKLKLWPKIVLQMNDAALVKKTDGAQALLKAKLIEFDTPLWRLIAQWFDATRVIDNVLLVGPELNLAIDEQGKANWVFELDRWEPSSRFVFSQITTTDGVLQFQNRQTGDAFTMIAIDATLSNVTSHTAQSMKLAAKTLRFRDGDDAIALDMDSIDASADRLATSGSDRFSISGKTASLALSPPGLKVEFASPSLDATKIAGTTVGRYAFQSASAKVTSMTNEPVETLEKLTLTGKALSLQGLAEAVYGFTLNKERVQGKLSFNAAPEKRSGTARPLSFEANSDKGRISFDGTLATQPEFHAHGKVSGDTNSLSQLSSWLGETRIPTNNLGAALVSGDIDAKSKTLAFTDATFKVENATADGNLTLDLSADRPAISGSLSSKAIDVDTLIGAPAPTRSQPGQTRSPTTDAQPIPVKDSLKAYMKAYLRALQNRRANEPPRVSLDELTSSRATRAPRQSTNAWSDKPFDLSPLKTVDMDLKLAIDNLTISGTRVRAPNLATKLVDGKLTVDAKDLQSYGGSVDGTLTIDAALPNPQLKTKFNATSLDTGSVLATFGLRRLLDGKSAVAADLTGRGTSAKQLVESLTGRVTATVNGGDIVGYDLTSFLGWIFGSKKYDPSKRTPIERLEAKFDVENGITPGSNLAVAGRSLNAKASGQANLPTRQIDYRAHLNLSWFRPFDLRIFGNWANPSYVPDWETFTRSPNSVASPLKVLEKADLKDPELVDLIDQVLKKSTEGSKTTRARAPLNQNAKLPPHTIEMLKGLRKMAAGG